MRDGATGLTVAASSGVGANIDMIACSSPHIAVAALHLTADQRLTVWATDAGGRRFNTDYTGRVLKITSASFGYISLAIPPDVKTVDLHFVVQTVRRAEFLIKPPLPLVNKAP